MITVHVLVPYRGMADFLSGAHYLLLHQQIFEIWIRKMWDCKKIWIVMCIVYPVALLFIFFYSATVF